MPTLHYINTHLIQRYKEQQPITLLKHFNKLKANGNSAERFNFYFANSAVYSSMIEGNRIDFDSYLRYTESGMNKKGKSFTEIEDLKSAYGFAKSHTLTLKNLLAAHKKATKTVLSEPKYRGAIRDKNVFIYSDGVKIYTGASAEIVNKEVEKMFKDIETLLKADLSIAEVFYFASMLHLAFVKIHPFADGNGRMSRLLEKWFLASKLGEVAWYIQSERLYQKRLKSYYKNVHIGTDYTNIDYDCSLPFLLMLPMALRLK